MNETLKELLAEKATRQNASQTSSLEDLMAERERRTQLVAPENTVKNQIKEKDQYLEMTSVDFQREKLDPLEKNVGRLNLHFMEPGMRQSIIKTPFVSKAIA
jgi:hypothetical protein